MDSVSYQKNRPDAPDISVIIPTYQHGRDIGRCLDSVLAQRGVSYEVIVIDDGSTDNTQEVLRPYLDRVSLVVKENGGGPHSAQQARNRGFRESRGAYVMFCDADVVMKPDCLAKLRAALDKHPEASYAYPSFRFGMKTFGSWQFDAETLRRMNFIHTSALIRRAHFPGFDETVRKFQDWDLWLTMLEKGHVGTWVPETLFMCIPHGALGMSTWIPRFFYRIPWRRLGWRMMPVEKYFAAEQVIREKHGLPPAEAMQGAGRPFWLALGAFALFELVSWQGYFHPAFGQLAFGLAVAATAVLAWWRLPLALLVVAAELLVGSQGGAMLSVAVPGLPVALSLRVGLFAALWLGFVGRMVHGLHGGAEAFERGFGWFRRLRETGVLWPLTLLLACFGFAFVRALWLGNAPSEILLDANGYAFFLLLPPAAAALFDPTLRRWLPSVFAASVTVVAIKSLLVLYVHSHRMVWLMRPLYAWVRDTRVGEITRMGETDFYRVFFQSHLFATLAALGTLLWLAYGLTRRDGGTRRNAGVLTLMLVCVVLGLSRSFWVGGAAAALVMVGVMLWSRAELVVWRRLVSYGAATLLAACALIVGAYAFPLPTGTANISLADLLGDRATSTDDAAANSRWELLPKLNEAGWQHPVLGSGFGREVTYTTSDPRLLAIYPDGQYTTAAFEWGWHDLWIKLGLPGLAAYAWLLWVIVRPHLQNLRDLRGKLSFFAPADADKRRAVLSLGTLLAVIALCAIHVFSPYLGHPLGIGALVLAWGLGVREGKAA